MLKAKVLEVLVYGNSTWAQHNEHYNALRLHHRELLTRCVVFQKRERTDHVLSYMRYLAVTGYELIETTVQERQLVSAGRTTRMSDERLPTRLKLGGLVDTVRKKCVRRRHSKQGRPEIHTLDAVRQRRSGVFRDPERPVEGVRRGRPSVAKLCDDGSGEFRPGGLG